MVRMTRDTGAVSARRITAPIVSHVRARRRFNAPITIVLALLALVGAGCGGGTAGTTQATRPTQQSTTQKTSPLFEKEKRATDTLKETIKVCGEAEKESGLGQARAEKTEECHRLGKLGHEYAKEAERALKEGG
jgi:hypothetical protein